jgi:membrane-bound lytic murein transglycosylase D
MKPLFVKATMGLLLCLLFMTGSYANPWVNFSDTSNKVQLVANNEPLKRVVVIKEANVVYPALLEEHEKYSLDYVQKFSVNRRAYLERTYVRSKKYFPKAHVILKKYNVPAEFAVLLALESAFNANAVSGAGAVGYWQIMDEVAKEYGLKIVDNTKKATASAKVKSTTKKTTAVKKPLPVDERKNFSKSTYTAARYLKDRMRNLNNNPLLVAASYNWGVGNVWNAMQRTGKKNPSFWDIKNYVPSETKAYVMNFIALNVIFKNYEKFRTNSLCFKPVTRTVAASGDEKDAAMLEQPLRDETEPQ